MFYTFSFHKFTPYYYQKMKPYFYLITLLIIFACKNPKSSEKEDFTTLFETSNGTETPTYEAVIEFYKKLATTYPEINLQTMGETDSGFPLHIVTYNIDGDFNFNNIREEKSIILINNGIHPGESDGIDATMLLMRDLAQETIKPPKNTVIAAIPTYNIGGALNRNTTTRVNQNGPLEHGFRGNANNYDLNRDFIKSDTKNMFSFAEIFHLTQPDIFIDTHVSNGADYQYTLTHLLTQHNKLGGELGKYLNNELQPQLEKDLAEKNWDITPYVNIYNNPPENGFSQFLDYPRYSTGYTTLWNTLGLMVETHMLKPYKKRVNGTYELLKSVISITEKDYKKIKTLRINAFDAVKAQKNYVLDWKVDTTKTTTLNFKGFKADTIISEVTQFPRLKYDKNKLFTKKVAYSNYFVPLKQVSIPKAYIIPQSWQKVIKRLQTNKVDMIAFENDTIINVETYTIKNYETATSAFEGHYPHYNTNVSKKTKEVAFRKGDFLISTNQNAIRYLLATLEPEAPDSFFNWNFFDTILQQKEGFSPYVFEDIATSFLEENPKINLEFEQKKEQDEAFATNWYAQLDWIYKKSNYYEKAHLHYPIYRIK